jgi:transcriptional regulator with XRE-family HTH domain
MLGIPLFVLSRLTNRNFNGYKWKVYKFLTYCNMWVGGDAVDKVAMGRRIREARKRLGLTQEQLALKINISDSYLTLIELGKRNISMETLLALSNCLGMTTDYIIKGESADDDGVCEQWRGITSGRSEQEINSAFKIVLEYFKAIDDNK